MIELRGVSLCAGGRTLLDGIDASIAPAQFVAILGPNGVGKTTLLRAIAGLTPVHSGRILLDGIAVHEQSASERARRVAFVTGDEVFLDALCVRDVAGIGRFPYHRWWEWSRSENDAHAIDRALSAVGMERLQDRLFSTLSAGERQRVWIAMGLAQETPVLLLDEPTSHLDVRVAHEILTLLRGLTHEGKTVVCALHDLNETAAYADHVALLSEGRLRAFGAPEALLRGALLESVYGIAIERVRLDDGTVRIFVREPASISASRPAASERRNRAPIA